MNHLSIRGATRRPQRRQAFAPALFAALAALAACGGGDDDAAPRASALGGIGGTGRTGANGVLALALTSGPSCAYQAINVTVSELSFNLGAAGPGGWLDIPLPAPAKVDLLALSNGLTLPLGAFSAPGGKYTQMRLLLAPNDASNPLANSVVPIDGVEAPLSTPSAQQSGLKVAVDVSVPGGGLGSYLIDFDACRSVTATSAGQYLLTPSIQVTPAGPADAGGTKRR